MTTLDTIAEKIIKEQELIIGPLAWNVASKVPGLSVDASKGVVQITQTADQKKVIDALVAQFERLFGLASHEACRHAAASLTSNMAAGDVPSSLRI